MTALSRLTRSELSAEQLTLWESIEAGRRGAGLTLTGDDGALVGPFNAMLHRPQVGTSLAQAGGAIRFASSLPTNLLEVAICTVGAHWRAEFEWWAHARLARQAGVADDVLAAIRDQQEPPFVDDLERVVHEFARSLLRDGRPSVAADAAAAAALTEAQLVDLVSTVGYYCYISFSLNAFEIPLPDGVDPVWT